MLSFSKPPCETSASIEMALRAFTKVLLMAAVAAVISNSMPAAIAADSPAPTAGPTCDDAINSLVACYSFVTGGEPLPSEECCAGFATVRTAQPVCLCQLVGNSGGGGDTGINVTLALELPNVCNVTAVDATTCAGIYTSGIVSANIACRTLTMMISS